MAGRVGPPLKEPAKALEHGLGPFRFHGNDGRVLIQQLLAALYNFFLCGIWGPGALFTFPEASKRKSQGLLLMQVKFSKLPPGRWLEGKPPQQ